MLLTTVMLDIFIKSFGNCAKNLPKPTKNR